MINNLIDVNDEFQFPVLHGILTELFKYFPEDNYQIFWQKRYSPEPIFGKIPDDVVPNDEAIEDIKRYFNYLKLMRANIFIKADPYIKKLTNERQNYLVKTLNAQQFSFSEREQSTIVIEKNYNKKVIEFLKFFCYKIEHSLNIFEPHDTQEYLKKLDIKTNFNNWYKEFEIKKESKAVVENKSLDKYPPILESIPEFLNEYTYFDFSGKQNDENKVLKIEVHIQQYLNKLFEIEEKEQSFIEKLKRERDVFDVTELPPDTAKNFTKWYSGKVIKEIDNYCEYVYKCFEYLPEFNEDKTSNIKRLNLNAFFNKWYDEFAYTDNKHDAKKSDGEWKKIIKSELHTHLEDIESKIKDKINLWKNRENLIECAAFCQLLLDKKYFVSGATQVKTVNEFSQSKYGVDIKIQLQSAKRFDRNKHKTLLKKYFS